MTDTVDKSIDEQLDNILGMNCYFIHHSCASEADPADGFGYCSCGVEKETKQAIKALIEQEVVEARFEELRSLALEYSQCSIPERAVLDRLKVLKPQLKDKS